MELHDFHGLTICKGDLVAYPTRKGSIMKMHIGTVDAIQGNRVGINKPDGKYAWVHRFDQIAVLGRN